jgi:exoribonuclease-2
MLTLPSRQLTGNENERENEEEMKTIVSIAQHTEWNPAADRVYIDALKQYVLDKDNSRSVGKRTSVYRTLIHPLCRLLGVPTTPLHVFNVLVQLGIWSKYENLHVLRFPWRLDFTLQELQRCAELAAQFGHSPTSASSSSSSLLQSNGSISTTVGGMNSVSVCVDRDRAHRVDLRTVCPLVFSIDAHTDQCEVDDAVSLEVREHNELWIWVHIADPSRCVAPNSELDLLARSRVASVYLPERPPATMFPPPLPQHTFSLLPHEDNYALSFAIHLNSEGRVEEYDIVPSIIPHVRPLTYDELDQALPYNNNNNNKKLSSSSVTTLLSPEEERVLCTLRDLCELRRRWRIQHGALVSDWPRAEIRVLNEGSQIEVRTVCDSTSWSRRMVTELMILVGDVTADFAIAHHIPIPFRSSVVGQQSPESSLITKKSPSWIDFINTPKYTYSVTPSGPHSALALPSYTQATSPIRRYHDLLVHHQIKAHLRGESPPFTVDKLSALVCELEPRVQAIHRLIHYSHRYWLLRYLERQPPDRRYSAKVLHVAPSEETSPSHSVVVHALLLDFGLKVTVRLSRPVAVDDIITLQLQHVDAFHNQITFVEELHS